MGVVKTSRKEKSMAQKQDSTNLSSLLCQFMGMEDPMLAMLEWMCTQLMEAEVSAKIGAASTNRFLSAITSAVKRLSSK